MIASTSSSVNTSILLFLGVAAVTSLFAVRSQAKKEKAKKIHRRSGRSLTESEQYVATSIRVNMPPARRMGITVDSVKLRGKGTNDEGSVALSMPIAGNTNVHGSAFAGSLYSVCVLSAWYTLVLHLRASMDEDLLNQATVVVQSANIDYKKPVWNTNDNEFIVATSYLSSTDQAWVSFVSKLRETRKTTCNISGEINVTMGNSNGTKSTVKAVEFKALLCVLLPRE